MNQTFLALEIQHNSLENNLVIDTPIEHEVYAFSEYTQDYHWINVRDAVQSRNGVDWLVKEPYNTAIYN